MSFLIFRDEVFKKHSTPPGHPESPQRLGAIEKALDRVPNLTLDNVACDRGATDDELLLVHTERLIAEINQVDRQASTQIDADTFASIHSKTAARAAVGAVLEAVDRVTLGSATRTFCLVRPPGHHAERDRSMGFCLFNNVAAGAAYALARRFCKRVAVYDFDVHHGNGTQEIFYSRGDVLYLSHHQYPFYPGTGDWGEVGAGDGKGRTINCPLSKGASEVEILFLWDNVLSPILKKFLPDILFLSAGFDAHQDDPLGQLDVSDEGFLELFQRLEAFSRETKIPLIYTLEGGYNHTALAAGVLSAIQAEVTTATNLSSGEPTRECLRLLTQARNAFGSYWQF